MEIFCICKGITFNFEINHHHHYHNHYLSLNSKNRITANFFGLPYVKIRNNERKIYKKQVN